MTTREQKISLLCEMIAFSIVDGRLHELEYEFLKIVAKELYISKDEFSQLFHTELPSEVIKSEAQRIQQFYRLALLMHVDGEIHEKEKTAIHEIGVNMGLNPFALKRVLKAMKDSPTGMVGQEFLLQVFHEQHN
ncbi:hypothetical protein FNO01nite_19910 [Flavobacterium noncentrifugens]|uniref:Tellurite resistance protein TerB n=1 Tax=Flavobacterium noncentrifugens TaxID=1128970 RepID=A0A1G8YQD2_9FLAO|nr:hypothetical protein FNO01nite_19910 [Flavobacterium noncentrifugens]SDK04998.1 hypothetical protein SAMN04487935_2432 [Flavobacterium noncentrifugens]